MKKNKKPFWYYKLPVFLRYLVLEANSKCYLSQRRGHGMSGNISTLSACFVWATSDLGAEFWDLMNEDLHEKGIYNK